MCPFTSLSPHPCACFHHLTADYKYQGGGYTCKYLPVHYSPSLIWYCNSCIVIFRSDEEPILWSLCRWPFSPCRRDMLIWVEQLCPMNQSHSLICLCISVWFQVTGIPRLVCLVHHWRGKRLNRFCPSSTSSAGLRVSRPYPRTPSCDEWQNMSQGRIGVGISWGQL